MNVLNVLLLQLDGKMMNLALGKLLAWHHAAGDRVELRHAGNWSAVQPRLGDPAWDRVYGSLIFERTRPLAERVRRLYPQIELGGTGWDFVAGVQISNTVLPAEIEALRPDNKWCVRECERSTLGDPGESPALPDFRTRLYNFPPAKRDEPKGI